MTPDAALAILARERGPRLCAEAVDALAAVVADESRDARDALVTVADARDAGVPRAA
jgi:hypothetical protein